MKLRANQDTVLGAAMLIFGLAVAILWGPIDSETGIAEKVRGRWSIGDALAPVVAGTLLAVAGLALAVRSMPLAGRQRLDFDNLRFMLRLLLCLAAALAVIRYAGPAIASLTVGEYRPLRDSVPWKYFGFVLGGGVLIAGMNFIVDGQTNWRRIALALMGVLILALLYDLPFEDLLLPPNGDV